jgi:uncharacterized protein YodC (DUF2158 family)
MRRRVMMVLASAALAGSLLATGAQARGGGGRGGGGGVGHTGGFSGAHIGARVGGFGGVRVGGVGRGYRAGLLRGTVGYATGAGYGAGIGRGTGIRYGRGILRGRFPVFAASAFAQSAIPDDFTDAYVPGSAFGAAQNPPTGGPSSETASGPGLTIVGGDGVSTKTVGMAPASSASAPSNTQNQAASAFRGGNLVRLRSGGPLMTVKAIKGDQVECFWTDVNGQINSDSFPAGVLQMG